MFGDMVDTIIGMTSLVGGGHAMEGDVRYVSEERVRAAGAGRRRQQKGPLSPLRDQPNDWTQVVWAFP